MLEFSFSDQVYCCHGGISQYEYDRSNLRRLARPTSWLHPKTDLPDALLLTDTLWADPAEYEQRYVEILIRKTTSSPVLWK